MASAHPVINGDCEAHKHSSNPSIYLSALCHFFLLLLLLLVLLLLLLLLLLYVACQG